jgi:hypothetical protein
MQPASSGVTERRRNQLLRKFDDIDGHGSLSDTIERAS